MAKPASTASGEEGDPIMSHQLKKKGLALVVASMMAVSLTVVMAGVSGASTGATSGGFHGTDPAITQYTAAYADPVFGPVSCVGVHVVGGGPHGTSFAQDIFKCTSTSGSPLTNVRPGEVRADFLPKP